MAKTTLPCTLSSMTVSPSWPRAQPDHGLDARRRLRRIAVAPAAVVAHRPALETRLLAHLLELLRAGVAAVGAAGSEQLIGDLAMALGALKLADRLAVPVEPEPFEPVENRVDRRLRRAFAVGVLDAQQERAAEMLGVEPVEQRRPRAADMQEAGRRRREAGDDLRHDTGLGRIRHREAPEGRRGVDKQAAASSRTKGRGKGAIRLEASGEDISSSRSRC